MIETTGRMVFALATGLATAALLLALSPEPVLADELPLRKPMPSAPQPPGPPPGRIVQQRAAPPDLNAEGEAGHANALAFISWAAASPKAQDELVVRLLAEARDNQVVGRTFCDEAFRTQATDHSRALIALSLLGEMRSELGVDCLRRFVEQPLPETGTVTDGEILERSRLESLQAKAIEGIAYARNPAADQFVIEVIAKHPSRFVRTQGIAAFLFNHEYSQEAGEAVMKMARPDERIFVDRVVRQAGETGEQFNPKLERFLKAHSEALPPNPEQRETDRTLQRPAPPDFYGRQR